MNRGPGRRRVRPATPSTRDTLPEAPAPKKKAKPCNCSGPLGSVTVIVPYFSQPLMLAKHLEAWNDAPEGYRFIVVDDGSKVPARPVVEACATPALRERLALYRIHDDIPWNRNGARNLGAHVAETKWIVHVDTDHVLTRESMAPLLAFKAECSKFYFFPRWRVGAADETRRKDRLDPTVKFGKLDNYHGDSYLIARSVFWSFGGYDERFSGCLGGGQHFVSSQLEPNVPHEILPDDIRLHAYTRDAVADANVTTLSRDPAEFTRRRLAIRREGSATARPLHLNFKWERVL